MPQKLRNYMGSLTYVNLVPACFTILVDQFSDIYDLSILATGHVPYYLLNLPFILCICNQFGANQHPCGSWALMQNPGSPFAIFKPAFRRSEDENKNNNT